MNIAVGFAQGFQRRGDENRRRRSEIAEAFQRYRQQNPHATLADMQAHIDGLTGGQNYLRGGAPSRDVLQSIAQENEQARLRAEQTRHREDLMANARMRRELETEARDYLRFTDDDDQETLLSGFAERFGMEPSELTQYGIQDMFNERGRNALRADLAFELQPRIRQQLELMGDGIDGVTVDDLAGSFPHESRYVLEAALNNARMELNRDREARALEISRYEDGQENAARARISAVMTELRDPSRNSQYQNYVNQGLQDEAATLMLDRVSALVSPAMFERIFGVSVEAARANPAQVFGSEYSRAMEHNRAIRTDAYRERRAQEGPAVRAAMDEAAANADQIIVRDLGEGTAESIMANSLARNLGLIWNSRLSAALHTALSNPEISATLDEGNVSGAVAMVEQSPIFQHAARNSTRAAFRESALGRAAGFEPAAEESFRSWEQNFKREVSADVADYARDMTDIDLNNPTLAGPALAELDAAVLEEMERIRLDIEERELNPGWIIPEENGGRLSLTHMRQIRDDTLAQYETLRTQLRTRMESLPEPEVENPGDGRIQSLDQRRARQSQDRADRESFRQLQSAIDRAIREVVRGQGVTQEHASYRDRLAGDPRALDAIQHARELRQIARDSMDRAFGQADPSERAEIVRRLEEDPAFIYELLGTAGASQ